MKTFWSVEWNSASNEFHVENMVNPILVGCKVGDMAFIGSSKYALVKEEKRLNAIKTATKIFYEFNYVDNDNLISELAKICANREEINKIK